jgi:coenzyme F420-dependent glucose-6-phosphate dehydrogenase
MTVYGYTLSSEEHPPGALVEQAQRAEAEGFDFVSISDHFHPWVGAQGHSPFVWSVLGAIAATTERVGVGVGVSCPIVRVHPAIVAHAAATTALLCGERFFLGVGTGEALNEHVLGHRWPPPDVRTEMLREAIDVMRALWTGDTVDHRGDFYTVENARLFDPPADEIPVIVSGFGRESADLAGQIGDGFWGTQPDDELPRRFDEAGGKGPKLAQVTLCVADDEAAARRTVHERWPNGGVAGQASQDLPTWTHFEQVTSVLTEEQAVGSTPCGSDVDAVLASVREYVAAGFDHVYFHQVGDDQDRFFRFWADELRDALDELDRGRA